MSFMQFKRNDPARIAKAGGISIVTLRKRVSDVFEVLHE
jgi:hypothetical protein